MSIEVIKTFLELVSDAERIRDDHNLSWETKYDLIFSNSISGEIRELDEIHIDYCDPDTTYQEDVNAYVNALVDKGRELRPLVKNPLNYYNNSSLEIKIKRYAKKLKRHAHMIDNNVEELRKALINVADDLLDLIK